MNLGYCKNEFIRECAMRNLNQCFSHCMPDECEYDEVIKNCYNAAVKLADLVFKENK